ncbi:flavin reductase family protein [Flavobacterium salilacus subsp. salilacus]|uniref:flavin reductase family protein n=1 Tax=Flavobacterium TaxID=237 RepID=UPI0010757ED5|nr:MULTISPECIES: flavin reductase family protein [Flavobacterium]KAF2518614.1 flavin reductase family protein [Flavobacterium salilacus subsp. salilacus]MBE1613571.1 flavin reductase family protein [Flavobacterium sp. SaA2.13]
MQIDPAKTSQRNIYKILSGAIIPRPIAWVSSISDEGITNLAPFSFFNMVGDDPPHIMFSTVRTGDKNKDTLNNVLATKQFVVNLATEDLVEKMNDTSASLPPNESEFDFAGLTPAPSVFIKPPRVQESPVSMECELVHHYSLEGHQNGGATIMIGRVVMIHIDESILLDDFKINMETYKPVARLAGSNYAGLGEIFSIKRPI